MYDQDFEQAGPQNNSYKNQAQPGKQREYDVDSDGGNVTVVSARTPNRNNEQFKGGVSGLPPPNRNHQQPTNRSYQQQHPNNRNHGNLSMSQRIETTTTPLQLPPLASLRANVGSTNVGGVQFKDGATDV